MLKIGMSPEELQAFISAAVRKPEFTKKLLASLDTAEESALDEQAAIASASISLASALTIEVVTENNKVISSQLENLFADLHNTRSCPSAEN